MVLMNCGLQYLVLVKELYYLHQKLENQKLQEEEEEDQVVIVVAVAYRVNC